MLRNNWKLWIIPIALGFFTSGCSLFRPAVDDRPSRPPDRNTSSDEMRFRLDVVGYAGQFKGTRYKYAGTSPKTGFDCSGFTSYVYERFGIELSHSSRAQENQGRPVRLEDVQPGDLIFYRRNPRDDVFHVSLVTANDREGIRVIHSVSKGVMEENITTSSYWRPLISSARTVISN